MIADLINQVQTLSGAYIEWAPFLFFGILLLAGLNLPVSEDAVLFISGVLSAQNPDYSLPIFAGVWAGAYVSDLMVFAQGKYFGPKLWQHPRLKKLVTPAQVASVEKKFNQYGIFTLIVGRFIPFGVRNLLFLTAGITNMNTQKFAFGDFIAATISCSLFFYLYYQFGNDVLEIIKKGNIVLFSFFCIMVITIIFWKVLAKKKQVKP